jgi:hypothetical protein
VFVQRSGRPTSLLFLIGQHGENSGIPHCEADARVETGVDARSWLCAATILVESSLNLFRADADHSAAACWQ